MHEKSAITYLSFLFLIFLFSCETELDVTAEWKESTVVYGLLDLNDSIHRVRIEKSFLGNDNAFNMAKWPDSIYYKPGEITAVLREKLNGVLTRSDTLERKLINGKDKGVFAYPEQVIYITEREGNKLVAEAIYELIIYNHKNHKIVLAETPLVANIRLLSPGTNPNVSFVQSLSPFRLAAWKTIDNVGMYELVIRFYYKEYLTTDTGDPVHKSLDWTLSRVYIKEKDKLYERYITNSQFFEFLAANVEPIANVKRKIGKVDFFLHAAANDYADYYRVNRPVTKLVNVKTDFSNIKNGLGIFSSKNTFLLSKDLQSQTIDSLISGRHTKNLNFCEYCF